MSLTLLPPLTQTATPPSWVLPAEAILANPDPDASLAELAPYFRAFPQDWAALTAAVAKARPCLT